MAFFSHQGEEVPVSREELALFHSIDRKLFTRLVVDLSRDRAESAQVMALWMWLEHNGKEFNFVYKTMTTLPNTLLNAMAQESVLALRCIQSDDFPRPDLDTTTHIPILQTISKSGVTLKFFHENRVGIMRGVSALFRDICLKAFQEDLLLEPHQEIRGGTNVYHPPRGGTNVFHPPRGGTYVFHPPRGGTSTNVFHPPRGGTNVFHPGPVRASAPHFWNPAVLSSARLKNLHGGFDPYDDLSVQRESLNKEMEEVLSNLTLNDDEDDSRGENQEVPPHDRTIFLTFSKGYPITENEIREFITNKFGDVIEAIYMQEVLAQQPLYARLVVRSATSIPVILDGKSKAKFTIRGKHVWARKYVQKTHTTSP